MSDILKAKVNNTYEFDSGLEVFSKLDISSISKDHHHLLYDNSSYHVKIVASDFYNKTYRVSINNTVYEVKLYNSLDALIDKMGFSVGAKKEIKSISAPMPGLIIDIAVAVGQEVKENDTLFILEAMKMENSITSPINGVIKAVNVKKNDAVEKNHVIIEFE